jgi:hypothetical protein
LQSDRKTAPGSKPSEAVNPVDLPRFDVVSARYNTASPQPTEVAPDWVKKSGFASSEALAGLIVPVLPESNVAKNRG